MPTSTSHFRPIPPKLLVGRVPVCVKSFRLTGELRGEWERGGPYLVVTSRHDYLRSLPGHEGRTTAQCSDAAQCGGSTLRDRPTPASLFPTHPRFIHICE